MKKLIAMLMLSLLIVSCGDNSDKEDGESRDNRFVYAQLSGVKSLDPHKGGEQYSQRIMSNIYDTLIEMDLKSGRVIPVLAESWEQVDDVTIKFNLRQGVKFHSGKEFKASDVKFSIERAMNGSDREGLFNIFKDVIVVDDYTVLIKTKQPFAPVYSYIAHKAVIMLNEEFVTANNNVIDKIEDGTGAYKLENWDEEYGTVLLRRNKEYFRGKPAVRYIEVINEANEIHKVSGLDNGLVDIVADTESLSRAAIKNSEKLRLVETASFFTQYLGMNVQNGPLKDIRVRQAIALGIDKDKILKTVLMGAMEDAQSFVSPAVFGHSKDAKTLGYDIEKAKQLLKEAGYSNLKIKLTTSNNTTRMQLAEAIRGQLLGIGIEVQIEVLDWSAFLEKTNKGDTELFIIAWSPSTGDADYALMPTFHSSNKGSKGNRSFYESEKVDSLLEKGRTEMNPEKRKEIYKEIQDIINKEIPAYPLYFQPTNAGLGPRVEGFEESADGTPYFYKLKIKGDVIEEK